MKFTKVHGAGNDFVMVDARSESSEDWSALAVAVCDRHFGVGADGLLLVSGDRRSGFAMTIYNSDGSKAEMCGNGIRCFARYLHERGEIGTDQVTVATGAGPRWIHVVEPNPKAYRVTVGMGVPDFAPANIPVDLPGDRIKDHPFQVNGEALSITSLSVGNPHAVAFVDNAEAFDLLRIGPLVERHRAFPKRVNFEIAQVIGPNQVRMRVWERGAGITLACGTGAAATTAAAVLTGRAKPGRIDIRADGGLLTLEWEGEGREVKMTGPAETVYEGRWLRQSVAAAGARPAR